MTRDEAEAVALLIRAAVAEAGHDPSAVMLWEYGAPVGWQVTAWPQLLPTAVLWTAWLVTDYARRARVDHTLTCWPCWIDGRRGGCEHDPWTSERPRLERAR